MTYLYSCFLFIYLFIHSFICLFVLFVCVSQSLRQSVMSVIQSLTVKAIKFETVISVWCSCDRASLMYSFKFNQQDATLYNILYCCQCCTRFGRFLHPSSGAQNCTHSIWYMPSLLAATTCGSSKQAWHIPDAVCTVLSS